MNLHTHHLPLYLLPREPAFGKMRRCPLMAPRMAPIDRSTRRLVGVNERGLRVGQDHQNAVLTDRDVELVLRLRADGMLLREIAEKFDCHKTCIWKIVNGVHRWQRVVAWRAIASP